MLETARVEVPSLLGESTGSHEANYPLATKPVLEPKGVSVANGSTGVCADIRLIQTWRKKWAGLSEPLRT